MSTSSRPHARLFGRTRGRLLAELFGHSDQSFHLRELVRKLETGNGAVQRELSQLLELGLIVQTFQGNQTLYRANGKSPVFEELRSLIAKTEGVHDALRSALAKLGSGIKIAFIYGSVARQQERVDSDVDLMIIGDVSFKQVVSVLAAVQRKLGREINSTIFPPPEFRTKALTGNSFLDEVLGEKKIFLIGTQDELTKLVAEKLAGATLAERRRDRKSLANL